MSFSGPVTRSDGEGMRAVMEDPAYARMSCYLVADMSGCAGIEPDARKYMAEWSRDGGQLLAGVAVYGVSFALRTIISLTLAAIKFLGREQIEVVFFKSEAEALKWVAGHRAGREA